MKGKVLIVLFVSALLFAACSRGPKIMLRLNPKEGDSFKSYVTLEQEISQTIGEERMDMVQTVGTGYTLDVISVDSLGNASVRLTYDSIYYKTSGVLGEIEYDSKNPPEDMNLVHLALDGMLGRSITMKISPSGEILEVEGSEEMIEGIVENIELSGVRSDESIGEMLRDQFGEDALREMMENWLIAFPEDSVGVGDEWERTVITETGFTLMSQQRWTLKSRANGIAVVEVQAALESDTTEESASGLDFSVAGDLRGTFEVNEATGFSLRGHSDLEMTGEVDAGVATWPMSIRTKTSFEPIESSE